MLMILVQGVTVVPGFIYTIKRIVYWLEDVKKKLAAILMTFALTIGTVRREPAYKDAPSQRGELWPGAEGEENEDDKSCSIVERACQEKLDKSIFGAIIFISRLQDSQEED